MRTPGVRRHRLAEAADRGTARMRVVGRWPGCCGRGFGCTCYGERGLLVGGQMGPPPEIRQRCYLCGGNARTCACVQAGGPPDPLIAVAVATRPEDWAPAARAILEARGAWRR